MRLMKTIIGEILARFYDEIQVLNDLGVITVAAAGNEYGDWHGKKNGDQEIQIYLQTDPNQNFKKQYENSYEGIGSYAAVDGVISVGATYVNAEHLDIAWEQIMAKRN